MIKTRLHNIPVWIGLIFILLFLVNGCATLQSDKSKSTPAKVTKKENKNAPLYYDFEDVLLPKEMKLDKDASFVFETPGVSAGVLVLQGWVDITSLINFFESNMAKDNWNMLTKFKSSRTIMLFRKETRWCVINITDKDFRGTHIEIWVAPALNGMGSGLMK